MPHREPQIIAMGGGGFTMEPDNPKLDRYVLEAAGRPEPSVCFLPTAAGDDERYVAAFYESFAGFSCQPSHFLFFSRVGDLRDHLLAQDVIYVGGGNTKSMLGVWREYGLPEVLREAWQAGVVLAGVSAGALCWFEEGLTDSYAGGMTVLKALGLLPGSFCPHYESDSERRPALFETIASGDLQEGWAVANSAAVHFRGHDLHQAVASVPGKRAWRLKKTATGVEEEELPTIEL
jgi:dipeptidase E